MNCLEKLLSLCLIICKIDLIKASAFLLGQHYKKMYTF